MDNILEILRTEYPKIKWRVFQPEETLTADYGDGYILEGKLNKETKQFFVLKSGTDYKRWGDVIASELYHLPKEEEEDAREYQ